MGSEVDGVDTATGDVMLFQNDLSLDGTGGMDFELNRYYDSNEANLGHATVEYIEQLEVDIPIFKFSANVRTAFYTTNTIESLNPCYRPLNRQRSVFPNLQALLKAFYLSTFEVTKKWAMPIGNQGKVLGELSIMFPDRLAD